MGDTDTKTFQHFKFTLPIIKTRIAVVKNEQGQDVEKKYVEGVASSTDLDLHGDRMDPSAIKSMADSLHQHIIKLNAEHDTSWQSELGDISKLDVSEDNRLLIEAELNDMSKSHDLWYAITDLDKKLGLSIGGYVKEYEMVKEEFKDEETGEIENKWVKHYKNIQLDHIAVTSSPANPKTWVGAIAKSIQEDSQLLTEKLEEEENLEKTEEIDVSKPYPNEHACRLQNPDSFQKGSFRSTERDHNGKKYRVIMGRPTGKTTMEEQAYRYNKDTWSADEARSHCTSHKGSFEAAKPKTKSIEEMSTKEKNLRELASRIVRAIQNLEADLLLELTYGGLNILTESQVQLIDSILLERSFPMKTKDVSLEADEAKKADAAAKPEGETDEKPATPENEPKEETTPVEEPKEGEDTETPAKPADEKPEEKPAEEKPEESKPADETETEETKPKDDAEKAAKPKDGDECTMPDGKSKGHLKGGVCVLAKSEGSSGDKGEEKEETEETDPAKDKSDKSDEEKPADKTEEKSVEQFAELLKSIQGLTEGMKEILKTNEALTKRIKELEKEPATRKTIELEKGVGDEEAKEDSKTLKQEMEEKIAEARKVGGPNLFASIQKIRSDYSKKIREQV